MLLLARPDLLPGRQINIVGLEEEQTRKRAEDTYYAIDDNGKALKRGAASGRVSRDIMTRWNDTMLQLNEERMLLDETLEPLIREMQDPETMRLARIDLSLRRSRVQIIMERDRAMVHSILRSQGDMIALVGVGHLAGMARRLDNKVNLVTVDVPRLMAQPATPAKPPTGRRKQGALGLRSILPTLIGVASVLNNESPAAAPGTGSAGSVFKPLSRSLWRVTLAAGLGAVGPMLFLGSSSGWILAAGALVGIIVDSLIRRGVMRRTVVPAAILYVSLLAAAVPWTYIAAVSGL